MKIFGKSAAGIADVRSGERGVALVLVMLISIALLMLAGSFAYSIKVETRLATNTESEIELEWLGRSGAEMARWILTTQSRIPREAGIHALNQFWAGGPGAIDDVDNPFLGMSLKDIQCGEGRFSLTIVDQERKLNINVLDPQLMDRVVAIMGGSMSDGQMLYGAIRDWTDRDDQPMAGGGAESDFYLGLDPPYYAKNGPMNDITELLKVRGVTPELFWGPTGGITSSANEKVFVPAVGLVDLFCANSSGQVNVNTASSAVLQAALGLDPMLASRILEIRAGPDGVDGTIDDAPFRTASDVSAVLGVPVGGGAVGGGGGTNRPVTPGGGMGGARIATSSQFFEVVVDAQLGQARRRFIALVRRGGASPNDRGQPQVVGFRRE